MKRIKLTSWELAQCETALRERVSRLRELGADDDAIKQTESLQSRFCVAETVLIYDPRESA